MGLFQKRIGPVFLKEDSESQEFIERLQRLSEQASDELKVEIDRQIKIALYGLQGEKSIAFELKNSGMDMYILHDIYLEVDGLSAQIDYLLVTRKHVYVLECKNLIGNIEVDNSGNFIRTYELSGKKIKEGIYSPITQNQRHLQVIKELGLKRRKNILAKTLYEKSFESSHKSLVVLANSKTCLNAKFAKKEVKEKIIRLDQLNVRIKEIEAASRESEMSSDMMKEVAESFLSVSVKNSSDYAKKYEELVAAVETGAKKSENEKCIEEEIKEEPKEIFERTIPDKDDLVSELKKFRLESSRAEGLKPYYIFTDAQMNELIEKKPETKEQLLQVSGFGKVKVEKYGEFILKILNNT
ncbi:MAG: NERD domain-containing protein [Lachnospiraceae bacterium]|nr:NERD domain-containing protein [Lachnospiraceae bacterium]